MGNAAKQCWYLVVLQSLYVIPSRLAGLFLLDSANNLKHLWIQCRRFFLSPKQQKSSRKKGGRESAGRAQEKEAEAQKSWPKLMTFKYCFTCVFTKFCRYHFKISHFYSRSCLNFFRCSWTSEDRTPNNVRQIDWHVA